MNRLKLLHLFVVFIAAMAAKSCKSGDVDKLLADADFSKSLLSIAK